MSKGVDFGRDECRDDRRQGRRQSSGRFLALLPSRGISRYPGFDMRPRNSPAPGRIRPPTCSVHGTSGGWYNGLRKTDITWRSEKAGKRTRADVYCKANHQSSNYPGIGQRVQSMRQKSASKCSGRISGGGLYMVNRRSSCHENHGHAVIKLLLGTKLFASRNGSYDQTVHWFSPSATTTIQGIKSRRRRGIRRPDQGKTPKASKTWWPPTSCAPRVRPTFLLIMTDDQGYGRPRHLRRSIPTPALDRTR